MIVYGSSFSPFVRKVLAFGVEKGIALELSPAGMGRGGPAFEECSPFGKMPGFRDPGADKGRDFCISDSTAIITYLEAKFPEPNMIPADPIARARTIWFEEFTDTILFAMMGKVFFNRFVAPRVLQQPGDDAVADAAVATELPPLLDYLEGVIPPSGFLVEDRITLADIAVASPFVNLAHVECPIDAARWPKTASYVRGILARPSFAPIVAAEQAFVARTG
ncbi:MAG: Glutathione S-transferase family protein [Sphingomonas bacterium]|uniref:glutathione S-transferase family protein n=1 Tax=Sphingomonas bacterium TaxID=1895847 RepID=UPI00260C73B5|nr:glutathione S-transferase family protein [Sphingomonas bacterium]MDB5706443.1 Glutathione S-transferase family protein [Sphingomonas bacterium]